MSGANPAGRWHGADRTALCAGECSARAPPRIVQRDELDTIAALGLRRPHGDTQNLFGPTDVTRRPETTPMHLKDLASPEDTVPKVNHTTVPISLGTAKAASSRQRTWARLAP
jgi:hypothetical protein